MALLNYTGKTVKLFKFEDVVKNELHGIYVAKPNAEPYMTIESQGLLNIYSANAEAAVQPLPDGEDNVIVTQLYAMEARRAGVGTGRIFVIDEPVFSTSGELIGCMSTKKFI